MITLAIFLTRMSHKDVVKYIFKLGNTPSSHHKTSFAEQFKRYRLISGLLTLQEFSYELSNEGINIDPSVLSRWQGGARLPKDRVTVALILRILVKFKGINSIEEANSFMEAAGCGYLTSQEINELFDHQQLTDPYARIKHAQEVLGVLQYYLIFLEQGGRGNILYYPHITSEESKILKVINDCLELKIYSPLLTLWDYFGKYLWDTGKWDLLEEIGKKMYGIALVIDPIKASRCHFCMDLSWLYIWQKKFDLAQKILKEVYENPHKIKNNSFLADYYQKLGVLYLQKFDMENAEIYFLKSHSHSKLLGNPLLVGKSYLHLANLHNSKNQLDRAEEYYHLSIHNLGKNNLSDYPKVMFYLGKLYTKKENHLAAKQCYFQSLEIQERIKSTAGKAWACYGIAEVSKGKEKKEYAAKAAQYFTRLGMMTEAKSANLLIH